MSTHYTLDLLNTRYWDERDDPDTSPTPQLVLAYCSCGGWMWKGSWPWGQRQWHNEAEYTNGKCRVDYPTMTTIIARQHRSWENES